MFRNIYDRTESETDEELNFIEHWENSIEKQIVDGAKLRKSKYRIQPEPIEYNFAAINDGTNSPCRNLVKRDEKSKHKIKDISKKKSIKHIRREENYRCPLRIAELAFPSKRHCLETWKNRSKTLPIIMVERLKQIVLDQKPIVQVSDAINCFKRRKRKRNTTKKNIKSKGQDKIKILCSVFGYKLMKMLEKPVAIELSPYLAKIYDVVNNDVTEIMRNSINETCFNNYQETQKDIVKKITVLIAGILEESSFKIILEDLQDIEEEEGHVLDFIDQVIENVTIYCEDTNETISVEHETSSEQLSVYDEAQELNGEEITKFNTDYEYFQNISLNLIDNIISEKSARFDISPDDINNIGSFEESFTNKANSVDIDSLKEYINDILIDIMQTAIKIYSNNLSLTKDEIEDETVKEHDNFKLNENDLDTKNIKELYNNNNINENINDIEDNDNDQNQLNAEYSGSQNEILNGTGTTISSTDTPDDSDKKVKFSDFTIDKNIGLLKFRPSETKIWSDSRTFKTKNITIPNKNNIRNAEITKTIYLTSPNPYLLSNADESWPEEVSLPLTKSLASINKSVISLGRIRELEEDLLSERSFVNYDHPYSNELSFEVVSPVISNYYPDYSEKNFKKINEIIEENFDSLAINNGNHVHLNTNKENIINDEAVELDKTIKIKTSNNDTSPKNTAQFTTNYNKNMENKNDIGGEGNEVKLDALYQETLSTESVIKELEGKTDNFAIQSIPLDESFKIKSNDFGKILTKETAQLKAYDKNMKRKNVIGERKGEGHEVKYDTVSSQRTKNELHNKYKISKEEKKGEKLKHSKDLTFIKKTKVYTMSIQHLPCISIIDNIYSKNVIKLTQQRTQTHNKTSKIINKYFCASNEKIYSEWCNGLSNVVYNLDVWLNWIQNVTSQIELLHNERSAKEREWLILKNNVDYDTQSWLHLSQKQISGLKRCRNSYLKVMPKACICKKT